MNPLINRGGIFVTIISPVFRNVDKYGLLSGLSRTVYKAAKQTLYVRNQIQIQLNKLIQNRVGQMVLIIVGLLIQLMEMLSMK